MWQTFVGGFADFINFLYTLTLKFGIPSYGLAIIIMTVLIKIILLPLTQKQMRSMRAMQEIQPKIKFIQERYSGDKDKANEKILELYRRYNVNPLGGCLPLLIQMPIFIAFYQSLLNFNFVNPEHAGFLWIPNIGEPDPYLILAILSALTTFLQQKLSMVSSNNDKTQRIMLYFMPLMMAWIAVKMPAGLPLYWVLFNIFGILQQLYVNRTQNTLSSGDMDGNNYAAESNKGGHNNSAGANSRKTRKQRR